MTTHNFDPYKTLEVNPRASLAVIKAAYQALMKKNHPDHSGDEQAAKDINAAYEILSNANKREEYDRASQDQTGTIIGNYRVLESIAEGGFGQTYKGEHIITKDPVCIKHCSMVSPAHDAILIEETRAIWDLRHYALPAMRDLHRLDDGSLALIMSYIPGFTLEHIVEKVGKMDPESVAWIAERILNALMYLHHRDPVACVGSRLLLSVIDSPVPSCADLIEIAWLHDLGYHRMMLCDEICLKESLLSRAVSVFCGIREDL